MPSSAVKTDQFFHRKGREDTQRTDEFVVRSQTSGSVAVGSLGGSAFHSLGTTQQAPQSNRRILLPSFAILRVLYAGKPSQRQPRRVNGYAGIAVNPPPCDTAFCSGTSSGGARARL